MIRLDLGCGTAKKEGFIGIDKLKLKGVDIVTDIEKDGIPFEDNTVDEIYISHFLEHCDDLLGVITEMWRVCKDGAIINMRVPYYNHRLGFSDPTHRHLFTELSFDYYTDGHAHDFYTKARFNKKEIKYVYDSGRWIRYIPFKKYLRLFIMNLVTEMNVQLEVKKEI